MQILLSVHNKNTYDLRCDGIIFHNFSSKPLLTLTQHKLSIYLTLFCNIRAFPNIIFSSSNNTSHHAAVILTLKPFVQVARTRPFNEQKCKHFSLIH